jgi:hypothetical protein
VAVYAARHSGDRIASAASGSDLTGPKIHPFVAIRSLTNCSPGSSHNIPEKLMDPASAIVAALVSGILAGVSRSAEEAVYDGYVELKSTLLRRCASRDRPRLQQTVQELEAAPTAPDRQQALVHELHRVGADQDVDLQRLADQLLAVIENPVPQTSSPVERAQRRAGVRAVGTVLDHHIETVLELRNHHRIDDTDLLSAAGSNVPMAVQDEVGRLHSDIRRIVEEIAHRIEENNYREAEDVVRNLPLAYAERERANALVHAEKRMHISYQALRIAVEYFSELNENLLASIDREWSTAREANLVLGNAITVFELTEFVIRYVERFRLDGHDDIHRLHREAKVRLDAKRTEQQALARRASAPAIEADVREQILDVIRTRESAIGELEREWDKYLSEIDSMRSAISEVYAKVPTLEVIRDNARLQIDVMQEVAVLRFLRLNPAGLPAGAAVRQSGPPAHRGAAACVSSAGCRPPRSSCGSTVAGYPPPSRKRWRPSCPIA